MSIDGSVVGAFTQRLSLSFSSSLHFSKPFQSGLFSLLFRCCTAESTFLASPHFTTFCDRGGRNTEESDGIAAAAAGRCAARRGEERRASARPQKRRREEQGVKYDVI